MDNQLALLAEQQDGVISSADLRSRLLSRRAQARLFETGWLRTIAPNVYAVAGTPDTHRQRLRTGLLSLGDHSWVSYEAACGLHGLDRSRSDAVEFTVLRSRRRSPRDFAVHTTKWLPKIDQVRIAGLRATSATRTILDLAHARVHRERLEATIDSAVRLGSSAPHVLARRLETLRGSGRWGCRLIDELIDDSGGHSPLERRFLELLRGAGLPRPTTQSVQRKNGRHVARVDFLFEDLGVVVEVTGRLGHVSDAERARDAQRRNELQDLGLIVYEYTSTDVFHNPAMVIHTMRQRLAAATAA
jgi:very-short-patch-repair endonuclease